MTLLRKDKDGESNKFFIKKFFIKTFGCQMNFHDSELLDAGLVKEGFRRADSAGDADIIIFNTCSVRDHADHKIVSELGRLKKKNPDKKVVLAGCFAKQVKLNGGHDGRPLSGGRGSRGLSFDYCFGPDEISSIPSVLNSEIPSNLAERGGEPGRGYENFDSGLIEKYYRDKKPGESAAAVKITEGCDNYCSYCIVPYVRGSERSMPSGVIYDAVKALVSGGTKEILLLGQNVNSYRAPDDPRIDFAGLLESLSAIKGLGMVKFLTSHPRDFNDGLIELVVSNDKISKEIHLPVQSGSDRVLSAMNRGYTRRDYLRLVRKLKNGPSGNLKTGISVSTDIIVGFPGESEEDFRMTLSLMEEARFDSIFAFKYSPRPFTKAFEILDDVSVEEKKERLESVFKKYNEIKNSAYRP